GPSDIVENDPASLVVPHYVPVDDRVVDVLDHDAVSVCSTPVVIKNVARYLHKDVAIRERIDDLNAATLYGSGAVPVGVIVGDDGGERRDIVAAVGDRDPRAFASADRVAADRDIPSLGDAQTRSLRIAAQAADHVAGDEPVSGVGTPENAGLRRSFDERVHD